MKEKIKTNYSLHLLLLLPLPLPLPRRRHPFPPHSSFFPSPPSRPSPASLDTHLKNTNIFRLPIREAPIPTIAPRRRPPMGRCKIIIIFKSSCLLSHNDLKKKLDIRMKTFLGSQLQVMRRIQKQER